jgi:TRAP-type C4-dicarboxylate transport system permease small subunit
MIGTMRRGVEWLLALTRTLAAICLLASVVINAVNIVGRYVFSVSIPWAEEIMLFLMVGCVFTGCCAVAWQGRHIRMDVVISALPPKLYAFCNLLSDLVLIAASITVTVFAYPVITQLAAFDERSEAANFPLVIPQSMVPIGYSLMALLVAIRLLTSRRAPPGPSGDTHT